MDNLPKSFLPLWRLGLGTVLGFALVAAVLLAEGLRVGDEWSLLAGAFVGGCGVVGALRLRGLRHRALRAPWFGFLTVQCVGLMVLAVLAAANGFFAWREAQQKHWHEATPAYPRLLDFLARELIRSGYDLKHVADLIFQSRAYQRPVLPHHAASAETPPAAAPLRRRLAAEQIVDSLFVVSGKPMRTEYLTLDPEGRRGANTFLNLGIPRRSWEFAALSNERDRPALALPAARSVVDVLMAFGWRESRAHPTTLRDGTMTVLQPLALANSTASQRTVTLSDDHVLTDLLMSELSLPDIINRVHLSILSRPPTPQEQAELLELLAPGFSKRRIAGARRQPPPSRRLTRVSWSNHLHPEATRLKLALEQRVRDGDPPTRRLDGKWRERAEDVIWALVNSPEFVFAP